MKRTQDSVFMVSRDAVMKSLILETVGECICWTSKWQQLPTIPCDVGKTFSGQMHILSTYVLTNHLFLLLQYLSHDHPMVQQAAKSTLRALSTAQGNGTGLATQRSLCGL